MAGDKPLSRRAMLGQTGALGASMLLGNHLPDTNQAPTPGYPPLLDHLVWLAGDLDAACDAFERVTGIAPQYGGEHGSGTHNAIVELGPLVYLEIAAPVAGAQPGHPWVDAARRRPQPHLYAYCMRSFGTLEELSGQVGAAGYSSYGPLPGQRTTPQGRELNWQLFIPIVPGAGPVIPFHIDWKDTPHPAAGWRDRIGLSRFSAAHPEASRYLAAIDLLAPGVELRSGGEEAHISAELTTPRGPVVLSS